MELSRKPTKPLHVRSTAWMMWLSAEYIPARTAVSVHARYHQTTLPFPRRLAVLILSQQTLNRDSGRCLGVSDQASTESISSSSSRFSHHRRGASLVLSRVTISED